jgi:hypothetical protein
VAGCRLEEGHHLDRTAEVDLDQEAVAAEDPEVFRKQDAVVADLLELADKESTAGSWAKERGRDELEATDAGVPDTA